VKRLVATWSDHNVNNQATERGDDSVQEAVDAIVAGQ